MLELLDIKLKFLKGLRFGSGGAFHKSNYRAEQIEALGMIGLLDPVGITLNQAGISAWNTPIAPTRN
ncbi:MAG: hypothetical protein EA420_09805 [Candidatus Competibacteraceae bacterium]|nr:MAG: hypothetical protein EA420_09805 [Candidatus Competibacteraceae bacterium]